MPGSRATSGAKTDAAVTGRSFKRWLARVRQGKAGITGLFWLSAGETTILPMPVEIVLVPMMQYARDHVWRMATSVTLGAVAGAVLGYFIAYFFMEAAGNSFVALAGWQDEQARFAELFDRYGFLAIVLVGMLPPIPFQLAIVSAGATGYPFALFVLATLIARGIRYFFLAAMVRLFGDHVATAYQNNRALALTVLIALFFGAVGLIVFFERGFA
jgi:membrane protein YqaA with SNARE-associated domain